VIQLLLACFVVVRMFARQALPADEQEHFVMQGTAASSAVVLDPRTAYIARQDSTKEEVITTVL